MKSLQLGTDVFFKSEEEASRNSAERNLLSHDLC
jgi:hypothetical protein